MTGANGSRIMSDAYAIIWPMGLKTVTLRVDEEQWLAYQSLCRRRGKRGVGAVVRALMEKELAKAIRTGELKNNE